MENNCYICARKLANVEKKFRHINCICGKEKENFCSATCYVLFELSTKNKHNNLLKEF